MGTHSRRAQAHRPTPAGLRRSRSSGASPTAWCSTSPRRSPPRARTATRSRADRIGYEVKSDIVLVQYTGAGAYNEERYRTDHPGMTAGGHPLADRAGGADDGGSTPSRSTCRCGRCSSASSSGRPTGDVGRGVPVLENLMNLEQTGRPHGLFVVLPGGWDHRGPSAGYRDRGRMKVLRFDEPAAPRLSAGGKGASLARMAGLELPVPPGFVVPADALMASLGSDAQWPARGLLHGGAGAQTAERRRALVLCGARAGAGRGHRRRPPANWARTLRWRCARAPAPRTRRPPATPVSKRPISGPGLRRGGAEPDPRLLGVLLHRTRSSTAGRRPRRRGHGRGCAADGGRRT